MPGLVARSLERLGRSVRTSAAASALVLPGAAAAQYAGPSAPIGPTVPSPAPAMTPVPPAPPGAFLTPPSTLTLPPAALPVSRTRAGQPAEDKPAEDKPAEDRPVATSAPALSLGDCIALALERQPSIRAVRASQEATHVGRQALDNIGPLASALSRDLPIRKQQSDRGILASSADVQRAHNEVVHATTQLYYVAVLAGQQEGIAQEAVDRLNVLVGIARKMLDEGVVAMTKPKLLQMEINLSRAREQLSQAKVGKAKAMAALREVMAVQNCDFTFAVKDKELPRMEQSREITSALVLKLAMERRPELALAASAVDAFRLEVYAQGMLHFRRAVPTLASASDIHSRPIPQEVRGPREYKPGAIVPEMPVQLVGTKLDRVRRALAYSHRADEVFDKSRNLVQLEAETAYLNFEHAGVAMREAEERYKWSKEQDELAVANPTLDKERQTEAVVAHFVARAAYLGAAYDYLAELSNLERVTAGGIRPAFPDR